jgi:hypothetical protein
MGGAENFESGAAHGGFFKKAKSPCVWRGNLPASSISCSGPPMGIQALKARLAARLAFVRTTTQHRRH